MAGRTGSFPRRLPFGQKDDQSTLESESAEPNDKGSPDFSQARIVFL